MMLIVKAGAVPAAASSGCGGRLRCDLEFAAPQCHANGFALRIEYTKVSFI